MYVAFIQYPTLFYPLQIEIATCEHLMGSFRSFNQTHHVEEIIERIEMCPDFYQQVELDIKLPVEPKFDIYEDFITYKDQ